MRTAIRCLLGVWVMALWVSGCAQTPQTLNSQEKGEQFSLVILHTSDFHGQMLPTEKGEGGASHLASYIQKVRQQVEKKGGVVLLLDSGDCFQGTPEGNLTKGKLVFQYMNLLGYRAMAVGNHEFDFGLEVIQERAKEAKFPLLTANLLDRRTKKPLSFTRPWVIWDVKGVRIGCIGLTTEELFQVTGGELEDKILVLSEVESLKKAVAKLRDKVDFLIALTHVGVVADQKLASEVSGVDLILGGHSHTKMTAPLTVGKTQIVHPYEKGRWISRVEYVVDRQNKKFTNFRYIPVTISPKWGKHKEVEELLAQYKPKIEALMSRPVTQLPIPLVRKPGIGSSPLGVVVAEAMRQISHAQIGFQNKGGVRADLPKGKVTYRHVFQATPFDNTVVVVTLTGEQLWQLMVQTLTGKYRVDISGATVEYTLGKDGIPKLLQVYVNGQPLVKARTYRVATNSFLARGGDGFRLFLKGKRKDTGISYRQALVKILQKTKSWQWALKEHFVQVPNQKGVPK